MTGNIIVKDNHGGEMYMAKGTALAVTGEGLGKEAYVVLKLDSGLLSQRVFGVYGYEGGNQEYVLTAGNRSLTDIEPADEPQVEKPIEDNNNNRMYIGIIAFAVVAAAILVVVVAVQSKKRNKKKAGKIPTKTEQN